MSESSVRKVEYAMGSTRWANSFSDLSLLEHFHMQRNLSASKASFSFAEGNKPEQLPLSSLVADSIFNWWRKAPVCIGVYSTPSKQHDPAAVADAFCQWWSEPSFQNPW